MTANDSKSYLGHLNKLVHEYNNSRLQHMKCAIACACLYKCLKHACLAKKSMPYFIQKASRCAADRMSKTTMLFIFHFLYNTDILWENHVYLFIYFIGSVVKIVLYFYFLYTKNDRF